MSVENIHAVFFGITACGLVVTAYGAVTLLRHGFNGQG
jgi:hypothetical protein